MPNTTRSRGRACPRVTAGAPTSAAAQRSHSRSTATTVQLPRLLTRSGFLDSQGSHGVNIEPLVLTADEVAEPGSHLRGDHQVRPPSHDAPYVGESLHFAWDPDQRGDAVGRVGF